MTAYCSYFWKPTIDNTATVFCVLSPVSRVLCPTIPVRRCPSSVQVSQSKSQS